MNNKHQFLKYFKRFSSISIILYEYVYKVWIYYIDLEKNNLNNKK